MNESDILLIKHAVGGRVIVDTRLDQIAWQYITQPDGGGGQFVVSLNDAEAGREAVRLAHELNVFIFKQVDGRTVRKIWHYTDGDSVRYSDEGGELRFNTRSSIEYAGD